jgi:uncharacterized protein Yka (UPF0111/DUF47 family)
MSSFRLIPKDVKFFDLFIADGENLELAARRLEELVVSYDRLEERVAEIRVLEHRGDEIDAELNERLEKAFVTPFDREDIHELTVRIDDVVDSIQEVAETFVIYGVEKPTDEARRLAGILAAQASQIDELENEADGLSRAAIGALFHEGADPLYVIKWRDVYNELEEAIDAAEDAGEIIERMIHKAA